MSAGTTPQSDRGEIISTSHTDAGQTLVLAAPQPLTIPMNPLTAAGKYMKDKFIKFTFDSFASRPGLRTALTKSERKGSMIRFECPEGGILLIGSTGNGKSSLGNFLIADSKNGEPAQGPFSVAHDNLPMTRDISRHHGSYEYTITDPHQISSQPIQIAFDFTVIDTPGINENDLEDAFHLVKIYEALQLVKSIKACLFVVKFDSKIDAQYRSTIQRYVELLPEVFQNVIIVVTEYLTDPRSVKLRQKRKISTEVVQKNILQEIKTSANLDYEPQIFLIDSMPVADEQIQENKAIRCDILRSICECEIVVNTQDMCFKKPHIFSLQDQLSVEHCMGEITGFKDSFITSASETTSDVMKEVFDEEIKIIQEERKKIPLSNELQKLDTANLVIVQNWKTFIPPSPRQLACNVKFRVKINPSILYKLKDYDIKYSPIFISADSSSSCHDYELSFCPTDAELNDAIPIESLSFSNKQQSDSIDGIASAESCLISQNDKPKATSQSVQSEKQFEPDAYDDPALEPKEGTLKDGILKDVNFQKGFTVIITFQTTSSNRYAARIVEIKEELKKVEKNINDFEENIKKFLNPAVSGSSCEVQPTEIQKDIEPFRNFVKTKTKEIQQLANNYMSLEEVKKRIASMRQPMQLGM